MIPKWSKSAPQVIQKWSQEGPGEKSGADVEKTPRAKGGHPQTDHFTMIFEGPQMMNNHVFFETRFFDKKNMIFHGSHSLSSVLHGFEGPGSILEVPRTDQNRKKWGPDT